MEISSVVVIKTIIMYSNKKLINIFVIKYSEDPWHKNIARILSSHFEGTEFNVQHCKLGENRLSEADIVICKASLFKELPGYIKPLIQAERKLWFAVSSMYDEELEYAKSLGVRHLIRKQTGDIFKEDIILFITNYLTSDPSNAGAGFKTEESAPLKTSKSFILGESLLGDDSTLS
jgi:hypothetical protein